MSTAAAKHALSDFRATGNEDALLDAFRSGMDAMGESLRTDPTYPETLETFIEVLLAYFGYGGHFAVIDCAVEMIRRRQHLGFEGTAGGPWALRHPTWQGGTFSRSAADTAWTLHHPDGRKSLVWKDAWNHWDGDDWPMGWQVRRPDGILIELEEDQWGDDWRFDATSVEATQHRPQSRTLAEAASSVMPGVTLTQGQLSVIEDYLTPWRDLRILDVHERETLKSAWACAMPNASEVLASIRGWLMIAAVSTAAVGILREWLAMGRDAREYLYGAGVDHLDTDIVTAFGNHWHPVRQFTPTDALASAFRKLGGIPSKEALMSDRGVSDTVMSIEEFFRAVDRVPTTITDWEPYSTQPAPNGDEIFHHDGRTGAFTRAELPPWYREQNDWIAVLAVRTAFAHAACAPSELVQMYELVTAEI